MNAISFYHHLEAMLNSLKDPLEQKLRASTFLDENTQVSRQPGLLRVYIVHRSTIGTRDNTITLSKLEEADLLVLLIQGIGQCRSNSDERFARQKCWECGTEFLIDHWEAFRDYVRKTPIEQWSPSAWAPQEIPPHTLSALAILCQGYLAVHAECKETGMEKDWGKEDIAPALEQMGWITFMAEGGPGRSLIRPDLGKEIGNVRKANWWAEVLDIVNLEDELKKEWKALSRDPMPDSVTNLVRKMKKNEQVGAPKIVAEAYCAIAKILGGEPCPQA